MQLSGSRRAERVIILVVGYSWLAAEVTTRSLRAGQEGPI
ncbi:MAG: hypothetical protein ACI9DC_003438, partial [Gammaproteobacteria bacterium]